MTQAVAEMQPFYFIQVEEKIKEVLGLDNYERFADNALAGFERFR